MSTATPDQFPLQTPRSHGPEGADTPKITVTIRDLEEATLRRTKQLGIDHVCMTGVPIPWTESEIKERVDHLGKLAAQAGKSGKEQVQLLDWLQQENFVLQGYLPFTRRLKPELLPPGEHIVTFMIRGYDGHFGSGSIKVYRPDERASTRPGSTPRGDDG